MVKTQLFRFVYYYNAQFSQNSKFTQNSKQKLNIFSIDDNLRKKHGWRARHMRIVCRRLGVFCYYQLSFAKERTVSFDLFRELVSHLFQLIFRRDQI